MHPVRSLLLAASENRWMRANATKLPVFRKAVKRFMPGERLDDALEAADVLRTQDRMATIFTRLGENVTDMAEADAVAAHYLEAYGRIEQRHLDTQISVKLTQLGLDMDPARCREHVRRLAARAAAAGRDALDRHGAASLRRCHAGAVPRRARPSTATSASACRRTCTAPRRTCRPSSRPAAASAS